MHLTLSPPVTATTLLLLIHLAQRATSATDCSTHWVSECTKAVSACCTAGAAQANTTCEVNRQLHYYWRGRCTDIWLGSAQPYNMVDCDIARLAGIAVLTGDTERRLSCTLDDIMVEDQDQDKGEGEGEE